MNPSIPHHKFCTSIISESEVYISLLCQLLHSSTNQELFEKHLCNKSSHYEKYG